MSDTEEPWDIGDGSTLFAWQVLDRRDNAWGLISAMIPALGISSPLVARSYDHAVCDEYLGIARELQLMHGEPIRLAVFRLDKVLEEHRL